MIPSLPPTQHSDTASAEFIRDLQTTGFTGDHRDDLGSRTVYATDNSIYQLAPQAILFPKDCADLVRIAKLAATHKHRAVKLTMRGGGTGTNGQSLTDGVVIDTTRYMNRILAVDPIRRTAVVQAGVVKDQLNRALAPYGLFFAPELSTSNRATIGGMINTDACGQGSCIYGKTSNHIRTLRVVLANGEEWHSRPLSESELLVVMRRTDRIGEIYRVAHSIEQENADLIERTFPKLNRFLTGYDLAHLRMADGGLNLNSVLCGSEGTLAFVAEAELSLEPIPASAALLVIRYDSFDTALRDARLLTELGSASVETIDGTVLSLARKDAIWSTVSAFFPEDRGGRAQGANIVEVIADDEAHLHSRILRVERALTANPRQGRRKQILVRGKQNIQAVWAMRKRAVGLLGNADGSRRPVPFVEDTAVPPERLADFIAEFRALLDGEGLSYGMFGHVDAGVLHVRPALDLSDPSQEIMVRRISDAVFGLVRKYGGILWGEHGKGVRSEYVPQMFGDLYPALQQLKRAFDPLNQLNPGKVATPGQGSLIQLDQMPLRGARDRTVAKDVRQSFDNAAHCNGNGACFDFDVDATMCPSFKGTGDRRFSPKGRASLLREWLTRLAGEGSAPIAEALNTRRQRGWRRLPTRALNSLRSSRVPDFSHEVRAAMDTCLACKACASQCPVKVDVPAFRSKFLELYYGRYLRPVRHPIMANIERLLPLMVRVPGLYNLFIKSEAGANLLRKLGVTALPSLPPRSLPTLLRAKQVEVATPELLSSLSAEEKARSVVFVQDSFTSVFEPQLLVDAVELVQTMGLRPFVSPLLSNGKALQVHGYLQQFEKTASRTASRLSKLAESNVPLVGIDPAMTLCYRQEYVAALGAARAPRVLLLQEWLAGEMARLDPFRVDEQQQYLLLPHCTERASAAKALEDWKAIFARVGADLLLVPAGCCGMAGTFGHEVSNRATSETIYRLSWEKHLTEPGAASIALATGYSCRSQVKLMSGYRVLHPVQMLKTILLGRDVR